MNQCIETPLYSLYKHPLKGIYSMTPNEAICYYPSVVEKFLLPVQTCINVKNKHLLVLDMLRYINDYINNHCSYVNTVSYFPNNDSSVIHFDVYLVKPAKCRTAFEIMQMQMDAEFQIYGCHKHISNMFSIPMEQMLFSINSVKTNKQCNL